MPSALAHHWTLRPDVTFLNHGSFGGVPRVVLEEQHRIQAAYEAEPVRMLAPERELEAQLDPVRAALGRLLGAPEKDIAFVKNATDGVNAVVRSFPFRPGDEVVITNHGYNACSNAARFAAERAGASVVVADIPFPISGPGEALAALEAAMGERTVLVLVDLVTSPTALVLPVADIVKAAHKRGAKVLVDAAHGPAMIDMDLVGTGADYTTGNLHKWLCGPKVSGFLHVQPELQASVRPAVISHAANTPRPGRNQFLAEFDWPGTFDPAPLLAVPRAIQFFEEVLPGGMAEMRRTNRELALQGRRILMEALGIEAPAPESMIAFIATLPLPDGPIPELGRTDILAQALFDKHCIEVPVWHWPAPGRRCFRISAQLYNAPEDYERLAEALRIELGL